MLLEKGHQPSPRPLAFYLVLEEGMEKIVVHESGEELGLLHRVSSQLPAVQPWLSRSILNHRRVTMTNAFLFNYSVFFSFAV